MSTEYSIIGKPLPRADAIEKVTGKAKFTVDRSVPGMLHAKMLRSPYPHAKIKSIDTSKAEALPGVKAVVTYKDLASLPYPNMKAETTYQPIDSKARFVGEEVAGVAAVDEETAEEASELIQVEYEQLPVIRTIDEALAPGAVEVHEGTKNIQTSDGKAMVVNVGDINLGFAEADFIVEDTYETKNSQFKYQLEPQNCLAMWDEEGNLIFWDKCKAIFPDRDKLATALGITPKKIRFMTGYIGGDHGAKTSVRYPLIVIMLAKKAGAPVKYVTRLDEHSFDEGPRMPVRQYWKFGVKNDGSLTASYTLGHWDLGAYGKNTPLSTSTGSIAHMRVNNRRWENFPVYTNRPPTSGFRGFGTMNTKFFVSCMFSRIAEKLNMDPVEFYRKNLRKKGEWTGGGERINMDVDFDMEPVLDMAAEAFGWKDKWKGWGVPTAVNGPKRRGVGMTCSCHHAGALRGGPWTCIVKYLPSGNVVVYSGVQDQGQGNRTIVPMIVAETCGVRYPDDVTVIANDTLTCPRGPSSSANSVTVGYGMPVLWAAQDAKAKLLAIAASVFGVSPEELDVKDGYVYVKASPTTKKLIQDFLKSEVIGYGTGLGPTEAMNFVATFAEVEVDTETGEITVLRLVTAHDVGQCINPGIVESGIRGSIVSFGVGYAIMEYDVTDPNTRNRLTFPTGGYPIPTYLDIPAHDFLFSQQPRVGPYGAVGATEGHHTGTAPAIHEAIYNAIGVRFKEPTVTPDVVLRALGKVM